MRGGLILSEQSLSASSGKYSSDEQDTKGRWIQLHRPSVKMHSHDRHHRAYSRNGRACALVNLFGHPRIVCEDRGMCPSLPVVNGSQQCGFSLTPSVCAPADHVELYV